MVVTGKPEGACTSKVLRWRSPFLFAWPAVERGRRAPRAILARSGRRVRRVNPVLRDLLAHQDCPALQGRRDPLGRTLQRHLLMALSGSVVPTAKRPHAERSATKTKCLSSHTVARVEVL
jgi:hypothetical protein